MFYLFIYLLIYLFIFPLLLWCRSGMDFQSQGQYPSCPEEGPADPRTQAAEETVAGTVHRLTVSLHSSKSVFVCHVRPILDHVTCRPFEVVQKSSFRWELNCFSGCSSSGRLAAEGRHVYRPDHSVRGWHAVQRAPAVPESHPANQSWPAAEDGHARQRCDRGVEPAASHVTSNISVEQSETLELSR